MVGFVSQNDFVVRRVLFNCHRGDWVRLAAFIGRSRAVIYSTAIIVALIVPTSLIDCARSCHSANSPVASSAIKYPGRPSPDAVSDRLVVTVDACCRFKIAVRKKAHIPCDRQNQRFTCINLFQPDGKRQASKILGPAVSSNRVGLDRPAAVQPDRSLLALPEKTNVRP
jgi:hypothetical protein